MFTPFFLGSPLSTILSVKHVLFSSPDFATSRRPRILYGQEPICFLRYQHRRNQRWQSGHGATGRCRPQDRRELQTALHGRGWVRVQGIRFPPNHSRVHVPGGGLYRRQRHRGEIHLRTTIRGRELRSRAYRTWNPVHGERGPRDQRQPVLHLHSEDEFLGWAARGFWKRHGRHGCSRQDGIGRKLASWYNVKTCRD